MSDGVGVLTKKRPCWTIHTRILSYCLISQWMDFEIPESKGDTRVQIRLLMEKGELNWKGIAFQLLPVVSVVQNKQIFKDISL